MAEFSIRADSVNVEQIMRQIRARIRDKRGVDYTEQEIEELAAARLERFLDPQNVRSDLLAHFRRIRRDEPPPPNYAFEDTTLFESHRAPLRWIRRLLRPLLKLFFNPNPLIRALHIQAELNARHATEFEQHAELTYEVIHNLVVELTRTSIEVRNLKMRVEAMSSRLEFDERRARALEGVVQYRPGAGADAAPSQAEAEGDAAADDSEISSAARSRRRRRRRGRKGPRPAGAAAPGAGEGAGSEGAEAEGNGPGHETAEAEPARPENSAERPGREEPEPGH